MDVTAESNSQFLAFRRFVYRLSKQLSREEAQAIVYIYFFEQKDSLSSATTLDILCKLESSGIATSTNPEKLLELMKDLKRHDLVGQVKDFLKKRKVKTLEKRPTLYGKKPSKKDLTEDFEDEDDLILRSTLEAALVQATVLVQHMEMLQNAISGCKMKRDKIEEVVTEAAQTSEALSERLRRAEVRVQQINRDQGLPLEAIMARARNGSSASGIGYINAQHNTDRLAALMSGSPISTSVNSNSSSSNRSSVHSDMASSVGDKMEEKRGTGSEKEASDDDDVGGDDDHDDESDEDDYEPMNIGIAAAELEAWEIRKRTLAMGGAQTGALRRPVASKTRVAASKTPPLAASKTPPLKTPPSFTASSNTPPLATSKTPPLTANKTSPIHYSRVMVPVSKPPAIVPKPQKAADPKRRSVPINYTPIFYAKTGSGSKPSSLGPITERRSPLHLSRSEDRLAQSVFVDAVSPQQVSSDDNYTTLHRTTHEAAAAGRGGKKEGLTHYYKPLDKEAMSPPDLYTAVQHTDSNYQQSRPQY